MDSAAIATTACQQLDLPVAAPTGTGMRRTNINDGKWDDLLLSR
jgi:hypothetical protein